MSSALAVRSVHHRFHETKGQSQGAANDSPASPATIPSSIDTSGMKTATAGLSALLGHFSASGSISSGGAVETTAASAAVKPNLDALNRVLAHYAAQSAAKDTVIALVKE